MTEQFTITGINGSSTMNAAAHDDYQQQLASRRGDGRYTLEEAALTICDATGERPKGMLAKLMAAAFSGALRTYEPGKKASYTYGDTGASLVRDFYEEAYWHDLNDWLEATEPKIAFRFPKPSAKRASVAATNQPLADWKDEARAIADEVDAKDALGDCHDSLQNISERVAKTMRARKIYGPRGPLSAPTILREALQGGQWVREK